MSVPPIRLTQLGSGPADVLRVVAYFDVLGEAFDNVAGADTVIRSAALVADCPVGARWASGAVIRYDAAGVLDSAQAVPELPASPDEPVVWLERPGPGHELDAVLIDRVCHLLRRAAIRSGAPARPGDPALLEVVLSDRESRDHRMRAIRSLGLDETREIRVLAVAGDSPAAALPVILRELPDQPIRSATIDATAVLLCYAGENIRALSDRLDAAVVAAFPLRSSGRRPWVGIGSGTTALTAPTSWQQAQRALRFASSTGFGRRVVAYERLGALDLLAELPLARVLGHRDIAEINEFASTAAGAQAVDTAEAFCVLGSLRRAAEQLHLHHSTVASRIAQVEAAMGWDLSDPVERFMATLLLVVRRVCMSSAELTGGDPTTVG